MYTPTQLPAAKADELQRTHGIVLDPLPDSSKAAHQHQQRQASAGMQNLHLPGAQQSAQGQKDQVPYSVLVPLKGIDVLANGRYRVQLNTFMHGCKKFSRNSTDLYEVGAGLTAIRIGIPTAYSLLFYTYAFANYYHVM